MKYFDEVLFSYRWHGSNQMTNLKRMYAMTDKTMEYEQSILDNLDVKNTIIDVKTIREKGVLYKTQGIPCIFQILTYKRITEKLKIIKVFGLKVFEFAKSNN